MPIYQPAEDSYLLSEVLTNYLSDKSKQIKILDMGSGSGIQAEVCRSLGFNKMVCADIDSEAAAYLREKGFKAVKTDLFSEINPKTKFNLIIFNPPYLPEHEYDKEKDTTGGKKGFETIIRFLEQAKSYLNKHGVILLLSSSFSKPKVIIEKAKKLGYKLKELSNKRLFFEELFVYEIKL